jgi:hypothetical protein
MMWWIAETATLFSKSPNPKKDVSENTFSDVVQPISDIQESTFCCDPGTRLCF